MVRFVVTKRDRELCALIGLVRPLPWADIEHHGLHQHELVHVYDDNRLYSDSDSDSDDIIYADIARLLRNKTMSSVRSGGCDVHCCAYSFAGGGWFSTNWGDTYIARENWPGMEAMQESGEIAMLLDYSAGTLTIYKNNRRLGIVQDGLAGEYLWMVTLGSAASIDIQDIGA